MLGCTDATATMATSTMLDKFLLETFPLHVSSRRHGRRLCKEGRVFVDGVQQAGSIYPRAGAKILLDVPAVEVSQPRGIFSSVVTERDAGAILKKFLIQHARSFLPKAVDRSWAAKSGALLVNGVSRSLDYNLRHQDEVVLLASPPEKKTPKLWTSVGTYLDHFSGKLAHFKSLMSDLIMPEVELFPSASDDHTRLRAEFRVWLQGPEVHFVVFEPNTQAMQKVESWPAASFQLNQLMQSTLIGLRCSAMSLRYRLYEVDFLTTLTGQAVVTLFYRQSKDPDWETHAHKFLRHLRQELTGDESKPFVSIHVVGRSKGSKVSLDRDFVTECLNPGRPLYYKQIAGRFSQPNGRMCEKMLNWALDVTRPERPEDPSNLFEMYCGNGNFSIALSCNFGHVLATEDSDELVQAAQWNVGVNGTHNVTVRRASGELVAQLASLPRSQSKAVDLLEDLFLEVDTLLSNSPRTKGFDTVLVDPPRAGLARTVVPFVTRFPHILYISCNPETAFENLCEITKTHDIVRCAVFDQFPMTPHVECGFYLQSRTPLTVQLHV